MPHISLRERDLTGQPLYNSKNLELRRRLWKLVTMNLITNLSKSTTVLDVATATVRTHYWSVHFTPSRTTDVVEENRTHFPSQILSQYDLQIEIRSDLDSRFLSKIWKEQLSLCEMKLKCTGCA